MMTGKRCVSVPSIGRRATRGRVLSMAVGFCVALACLPATAGAARIGNLLAWGDNEIGLLGDATATDRAKPVRTHLPPDVVITGVSTGWANHTLAATAHGGLLSWGYALHGKLGDGSGASSYSPIPADLSLLAEDEEVTAVAAAWDHSIALTSDGRVLHFGYGGSGISGNGISTSSLVPKVVTLPPGAKVKEITAGKYHNLALTTTGKVLSWGWENSGALGVVGPDRLVAALVPVPGDPIITAIAAGEQSSLVLTSAGKVFSWGYNGQGQLGDGSTTNSFTPVAVGIPDDVFVSGIASGWHTAMAITSTGEGYSWGYDGYGELGNGTPLKNESTPVKMTLPKDTKLAQISGGTYHSLAVTTAGKVLAWGYGGNGQLAPPNGVLTDAASPQPAELPINTYVSSVDAGERSSFAVIGPQPITARRSSDPVVEARERLAERQPVAEVLRCVGSPAAILDVYRDENRVRIIGVAAPGTGSRVVDIRYMGSNDIVGSAVVAADGRFATSVPAPPASQVDTARYRAEMPGGDPSPAIRLSRRLNITSMTRDGDTIIVKGKVTRPLASPVKPIDLIGAKNCSDRIKSGSDLPDENGNVTYRVKAPTDASSVYFRLDGTVGGADDGDPDYDTTSLFYVFPL